MSEVDPVMLVDYGPLQALIGVWEGDQGMDVSPEPDAVEENPYYETIVFEAAGDVTNAETQKLSILRYHQVVKRKRNDEVFHDQIGYWTWDRSDNTISFSLAIPRAVTVLAGGQWQPGSNELSVKATADGADWGISQSPFMLAKAKTTAFEMAVTVDGDSLRYRQTTFLSIYGKEFPHTDENTLKRVG
ncbi:heme-binding beta-barrel domain-containing protein [Litorivivens sp.]|uniref:heme-binding beta-barrel domain-containing protein n=1 Tax=Litorivivens sp. TaxID=2020868 RepID=UPI0035623A75